MNKEMLLLLQKNIEDEKENTKQLFKEKLKQLKNYQKETIDRVEKIRNECFPLEINGMFYKVCKIEHEKDYYWHSLLLNNTDAKLFISDRKVEQITYKGERLEKGMLSKEIYDYYANENYRDVVNNYKTKLDLLNEFLDNLMKDIDELYLYIAKGVEKIEEEKRRKNQSILNNMKDLEKKEEKKESKKVRIIIEIEE